MSDPVTKDELTEAVAAGIQQAFIRLGINHADPIEVQADMAFLRKLRLGSGKMTWSMVFGMVSAVFTALGAFIIIGFQQFTKG